MTLIWVKYEPRSPAGDVLLHKPSRYRVTKRTGSRQQGWNHCDPQYGWPDEQVPRGTNFYWLRYSQFLPPKNAFDEPTQT